MNYFYNSLSPYGSWVDVPGYGLCWQPTAAVVDPYWRPYSQSGRWMWSDYGWYWYSDYSWGWAPFHYGRWCSYPRLGWVWMPGSVWAPSWVTWRYTDGYCGWAPLPPGCGYRSGIGLTWYGRGVSVGFDFGLGWSAFSYVPIGNFCDWHVSRHCLPEHRLRAVHGSAVTMNRIAVHNHTLVNNGIEPNTIARASHTRIPTMHVRETAALPVNHTAKPERLESSGNSLTVVRPQLPKNPPAVVTTALASRGSATTHARPLNLGNSAQATATARLNAVTPPNSGGATHTTTANVTPPLSGVRDQGTVRRQESVAVAPPNSGVPRSQPTTLAPTRQVAPQLAPRNETAAPAVRRSAATVRIHGTSVPAPVKARQSATARDGISLGFARNR